MTSTEHRSGTDRIAEAVSILGLQDQHIIVNLQGDEIGCPPQLIHQVATILHQHPQHAIATLCQPIEQQTELSDPNIVKVIFDQSNTALYFSRATIPYNTLETPTYAFRHIGIYAYRVAYLKQFTATPASPIERHESLEQLRALHVGAKIYIEQACMTPGIGIDTEADLIAAQKTIKNTTWQR